MSEIPIATERLLGNILDTKRELKVVYLLRTGPFSILYLSYSNYNLMQTM